MDATGVLLEAHGRVRPLVHAAVEGLTLDQLLARVAPDANPIAWLVWHMARVQDAQVAELVGEEQLWVVDGWAARFGLAPDPANHGYGHTSADVASVRPESPDVLLAHFDATAERAHAYLESLAPADLDRVVDRSWDPPVTLGVRLVSIVDDCVQHVGQAAYVRGLVESA